MDLSLLWKPFFEDWPKDLAHTGVLVTTFDEQIPFIGFLVSDNFLLVDRRAPDSLGGRKVIIPFNKINAVKIVDPVKASVFQSAGFTGTLMDH